MSKNKHIGSRRLAPETQMMHYGYDPALSEGAVKCPLFQTSTFVFDNAQQGKEFFNVVSGRSPMPDGATSAGLIYSRINNPVLEILEGRIALWDEAEDCMVTSSGMSAISTTLMALSRPDDVVVYSEPLYGGTDTLVSTVLPEFRIQSVGFLSCEGLDGLQRALETASSLGRISVVLIETPDNPCNNLIDIQAASKLTQAANKKQDDRPVMVVDNTMCGPLFQQPLKHGADICVYSLTKYIGGHSDVVGGSCSGNKDLIDRIRGLRHIFGTNMDANTAWLIMRSLETLKVRMEASAKSAAKIAEYLQQHQNVLNVNYPGLLPKDDLQYQLYKKQCTNFGSTFAFSINGDESDAFRVLDGLKLLMLAVSLGATETLVQHPASMTHSSVDADRRQQIGVHDNLIRISVGLENPDDIIADLDQALSQIDTHSPSAQSRKKNG